jgi:uncharacterized DUF497 family protein
MEIKEFDWSEWNIEHIARHRVDPAEVEEVAFEDEPYIRKRGKLRYLYGYTASGRYLFTVYVVKERGLALVVTSRDMNEQEKKCYRGR